MTLVAALPVFTHVQVRWAPLSIITFAFKVGYRHAKCSPLAFGVRWRILYAFKMKK